ncbi:hypothetical protein Slin14017_G105830 [Septoria linicola]|nr:hypothetical protein Slin14017_G105830 [Septoria linicola]
MFPLPLLSDTHHHHAQSAAQEAYYRQLVLAAAQHRTQPQPYPGSTMMMNSAENCTKTAAYEPLTPVSLDGKDSDKLESPLTHLAADCSNILEIRRHLEAFFAFNTNLLNTRQYDKCAIVDGYDQDFMAAMHNQKAEDLAGWVDHHRRGAEQFPESQVKILGMNSKVDLKKGTASLFTDMEISGRPVGVVIHSMTITEFKICDGKWLCMRAMGMRGNGSIG